MIWHPFNQYYLNSDFIKISYGKGAYLYDSQSRPILDAISSWWVNLHGHAHPTIAQAIYEQALKLEQVIFANFTHEPAEQLAQNLLPLLPGKMDYLFFSDNGSTATEVALKMAIQYFHNQGIKKNKIIALENSYHGDTFGAMAVSERGIFNIPFWDMLFEVIFIPTPNLENIDEILEKCAKICRKQEVAAIILEPLVQGAGGMKIYEPRYLNEILALLKKNDILFIADEVMTGFGRTGTLFACEKLKQKPDIICLSKGITGGFLPLGVTACQGYIFDAFKSSDFNKTFFHGHSYTANPLACAAANASLKLTRSPETQDAWERIEKQHIEFSSMVQNHPKLKNIRHLGTIWAAEIQEEKSHYENPMSYVVMKKAIQKGVLLRPLGNTLYILPPYCISKDELNKVYEVILEILDEL
ncbi:MAG: adenosylmethionine--8-amino-7-oxononanoate aminotransferase BioA [Bacteroidia bacterium]|nr:MAG: adenosylmethionine--8-amino-7-oxononanoate aminotransferase BioA [Bacteroidia bacterium]